MTYGIQLDFDGDEPPRVFIAEDDGDGTCVAEVFEVPKCTSSEWSRDPDDWEPGPLANFLVQAMNGYEGHG